MNPLAADPPHATLEHQQLDGLWCATHHRPHWREFYLTATPLDLANARDTFTRAARFLEEEGAVILNVHVFLSVPNPAAGKRLLRLLPDYGEWPATWIGDDANTPPFGGLFIHAITGANPMPLRLHDRTVGTWIEDADASTVLLGGLGEPYAHLDRADQTTRTLQDMDHLLRLTGMDFSHVVRTRFYLDDILGWYGTFNKARTAFFKQHHIFDGVVPASTGIGAANPARSAISAGLIAVRPKSPRVTARAIPSPYQEAALKYGSSFSRAVEVHYPDHRRLMISGTASIAPDGSTVHVGDVRRQWALTCNVVRAILESRRMDWADVFRAVVYFRHPADAAILQDMPQCLPPVPLVASASTVCRHDLLVELEVDAAR